MARPKKDDKPEESAPSGTATISVDEFRKTRDSVIQGLTGLQVAVSNLMSAYMTHCNNILGEGNPDAIDAGDLNRLTSAFAAGATTEALAPVESKKEKKKRAKKERDPDMPKRPLTAAFLYGQNARPVVKKDLEEALKEGEKLGANAVNEEVTRRWNGMTEKEKQLWRDAYQHNMVTYKEQMEEYAAKKGTTVAAVHELVEKDAAAGAAPGVTSEEDSDKEASPPPKAPTPSAAAKGNKRRKTAKENGVTGSAVAAQSPVPLPSAVKASAVDVPASSTPAKADAPKGRKKKEAPQEKEASPEEPKKKRARKSKAADEAEVEPTPEADKRKRKRKSEA